MFLFLKKRPDGAHLFFGALVKSGAAACAIFLLPFFLNSQTNPGPAVEKHLETWQDWKFGLLMHWGPYAEWGVVESWSLCPEDEGWCERRWHPGMAKPANPGEMPDYFEYKKAYERLPAQFNPVHFDPEKWAEAAQKAGMKYVVFTTKHHDGFCMFDTKQTDYKVTGDICAFSKNPKANIAKEIFTAFRAKNMGIGAYFSKPDWHSPDFWTPQWPPMTRNVNYDLKKFPEKWKRFQDFTFNQVQELVTDYGPLDILWFDGGWVRPDSCIDRKKSWEADIPFGQDVDMPGIAAMARQKTPDIIIVNRDVPGPYQDYLTPEQQVPEKPLPYRWETCMTMGGSWSYAPGDQYKSTNQLVHLLVDIVAKGGNLLLNIGPSPEGELPPSSLARLADLGDWMSINSAAIYSTRPVEPYKSGKVCFTKNRFDGRVFATYLADAEEKMPAEMRFPFPKNMGNSLKISLLGSHGVLKWARDGNDLVVKLPDAVRQSPPCHDGWVLEIKP